jgi:nitroimidazol reductase NimA-like FMN-containing flavoprotein (pyridoxamine 5'-phosphate oxidase superfamily)
MTTRRSELTEQESLDLLSTVSIGHISTIDGEHPVTLPLNYRVSTIRARPCVVIRTDPGSRLGTYAGPASLQAEVLTIESGTAWSVLARGTLQRITDTSALPDPKPFVGNDRHQWMAMTIGSITGRRFTVRAATNDFFVEWALDEG